MLSSALRASAPPDVAKSGSLRLSVTGVGKTAEARPGCVRSSRSSKAARGTFMEKSWLFGFCLFSQKGTNFRWSSWNDERHKPCDFSAFGEHCSDRCLLEKAVFLKKKKN